ncbi:MAG: tyrosine-protein phosphatase [Eubacterium sp.]
MIDLHAHILPFMDDGSSSMDESIQMAQTAVQSGVTAIAVTPHSYADEDYFADIYEKVIKQFENELYNNNIDLKIYPSMEILACTDMIKLLDEGIFKTINNTEYVLVEFDFDEGMWMIKNYISDLIDAGYRPIIAHPERYKVLQRNFNFIYELIMKGCLMQLNKGSVFGRFGMRSQQMAWAMLENEMVHIIASDAHTSKVRTTDMSMIRNVLVNEFSEEYANLLLRDNPYKIVTGKLIN